MRIVLLSTAIAAVTLAGTPAAFAKAIPTKDPACPFLQGGICYSKPGSKTGCGDLETTTIGGVSYCKLGPKNNPKPVPSARERAIIQGSGG